MLRPESTGTNKPIARSPLGRLLILAACFLLFPAYGQSKPEGLGTAASRSALPAACADAGTLDTRDGTWWNAVARLLGGLQVDPASKLASIAARPGVEHHRRLFAREWEPFRAQRLAPIERFASTELAHREAASGPLYYPFSGPDTAYALAFFPTARELVLTGLEPVGEVPDITSFDEAALGASLEQIRDSLESILALSFFVTREMDSALRRNRLSGVTPIMLLFLARQGFTIRGVDPIVLEADASICRTNPGILRQMRAPRIPGVMIRFQGADDASERRLFYFRTDLSDAGLAKTPQYLQFVQSTKPRATLVKSASYLLHFKEFARLRGLLLERSSLILQDDTGIPARRYDETSWDRRYYGNYVGPIPMFAKRHQRDLDAAYRRARLPLGFGIGYRYNLNESNLQLYVRRTRELVAGR